MGHGKCGPAARSSRYNVLIVHRYPPPPSLQNTCFLGDGEIAAQAAECVGLTSKVVSIKDLDGVFWGWTGVSAADG